VNRWLGESATRHRLRRRVLDRDRHREVRATSLESELLSSLANGRTDPDIADILGTRPRTVNKHREHLHVKRAWGRTVAAWMVHDLPRVTRLATSP
jgi:DNA-binding CsgD family transcriptional regulator